MHLILLLFFIVITGCTSVPITVVHLPVFKIEQCITLGKYPAGYEPNYDYVVKVVGIDQESGMYQILEKGDGYEFKYARPIDYIDGSYSKVDCGDY